MIRSKEDTQLLIAKYTYYNIPMKDIVSRLSLTEATIKTYSSTPEYRIIEEKYISAVDVQKKLDSSIRTRMLVDKLQDSLEEKMETTTDPLQYIDEIKKMVDITGISIDTRSELNVVAVADLLDIEEFNNMHAESAEDSEPKMETEISVYNAENKSTGNKGIPLPQEDLNNPGGYETPTPSQKFGIENDSQENIKILTEDSKSEGSIWDEV